MAPLLAALRSVLNRRYLFHIHTLHSDGRSSVGEYCELAVREGYQVVIFTEHVRKTLEYDWFAYTGDIARAKLAYPGLEIWTGVEAKVLRDGSLCMPDELLGLELIGIAAHGSYGGRDNYEKALMAAFELELSVPRVWVHPGRWLIERRVWSAVDYGMLDRLWHCALENGVYIELGACRWTPVTTAVQRASHSRAVIVGHDAHSVDDLY